MRYTYIPQGTCSRLIEVEIDEENRVRNVKFTGGCHGNLQGISALVEGMNFKEVISRLSGIRCGNKWTSCPDQLAHALKGIIMSQKEDQGK